MKVLEQAAEQEADDRRASNQDRHHDNGHLAPGSQARGVLWARHAHGSPEVSNSPDGGGDVGAGVGFGAVGLGVTGAGAGGM